MWFVGLEVGGRNRNGEKAPFCVKTFEYEKISYDNQSTYHLSSFPNEILIGAPLHVLPRLDRRLIAPAPPGINEHIL
jgi:hypothetical protein